MRKARIIENGAVYHVIARTNRGEFYLEPEEMKELFLTILKRAKKKYKFRIKHFCIMSSHIHLLLEPCPGTNLSKLMQWILSVFAIRFNKIYGQKGHVWYDRFKSIIIRSFNQFLYTFRYISQNPVKAEICRNCRDYKYSGLNFLSNELHELFEPPDDLIQLFFTDKIL